MSDTGYFTSEPYSIGYYSGLNPLNATLINRLSGYKNGQIKTACELGFGNGLSLCMNAVTSDTVWYGNDLMHEHVDFAQDLLERSGVENHLFAESFAQFCPRETLPEFDFIALHGVWSWIDKHDRATIVDFIHRKLKPNGILYISYNCLPGQANLKPFRHIFAEYYKSECAQQSNKVVAVSKALDNVIKLIEIDSRFFKESTQTKDHVLRLKNRGFSYLAHEYLNDSWEPMYFNQVESDLSDADLVFLSPSHFIDKIPALAFNKEQEIFLSKTDSTVERQLAIDYITNRQFRREYWVKSKEIVNKETNLADFSDDTCFVQTVSDSSVKLSIKADSGTFALSPEIYGPFLACFSDYKSPSFGLLVSVMGGHNVSRAQVGEAVGIFLACGYISVLNLEITSRARDNSYRLNEYLLQRSRSNSDIAFFASPNIGGGMYIPRTHQLFLSELLNKKSEDNMINRVKTLVTLNRETLIKRDGTAVNEDDVQEELRRQYVEFLKEYLPRYRSLGILR